MTCASGGQSLCARWGQTVQGRRGSANTGVNRGAYEGVSSFLERINFDHKAILGPFLNKFNVFLNWHYH